jgi:hypothetical protein
MCIKDRDRERSSCSAAPSRRVAALLAAIAICLTLIGASVAPAAASALASPLQDPFYTPPSNLPSLADGTIIRIREVTMSGPQQAFTAAAYQLMFRTTSATGQPNAAVTTVLVPTVPAAGARVLATYEPAYDSMTLNCAPSYTLQGGNPNGGGTGDLEEGLVANELAQGWDVNVPDYEGLQSEWAVGPLLGYASLDSVIAAEHFAADGLTAGAKTKVTFNGYSGGSEAADWAAVLAPSYAPELNIIGIAAGGNFPDFDYTESQFDGSLWYGIQIGTLESFSRAYPQLNLKQLLNPAGLALAAQDGSNSEGCSGSTLNEPYKNASDFTNFPTSEALGADPVVEQVLAKMSLRYAPYPNVPEYLYNSVGDDVAHIIPVDAMVKRYCAAGVQVDYDRDPTGGDHITAIPHYWAGALAYLIDRFAGDAVPDNCSTYGGSSPTRGGESTPTPPALSPCKLGAPQVSGALGSVRLGMTPARVLRALGTRGARRGAYVQAFCGASGVRVGYATPAEMAAIAASRRGGLRGRLVWAVTANSRYIMHDTRDGDLLVRVVKRRAHLTLAAVDGTTRWYLTRLPGATGLIEARSGVVRLIGIAERSLTARPASRRVILATIARSG